MSFCIVCVVVANCEKFLWFGCMNDGLNGNQTTHESVGGWPFAQKGSSELYICVWVCVCLSLDAPMVLHIEKKIKNLKKK